MSGPIGRSPTRNPPRRVGTRAWAIPSPPTSPLRVFNGTATPGLGAELDDHLAESGFDVTDRAENWVSRDLPQSEVRHGPGREEQAAYVAEMIPDSETVEDKTLDDDLQIVIGFNYTTFHPPEVEEEASVETETPEGGPPATTTAEDNVCG